MSKIKYVALFFTLFIIWVILAADTNTFPPVIRYVYLYPGGDKAGHLILYGILVFLMALAFPRRARLGPISPAWASIILAALITLEEFSQALFPARTFSLIDLSFSFAGVFLGDFLAWLLQKSRVRR